MSRLPRLVEPQTRASCIHSVIAQSHGAGRRDGFPLHSEDLIEACISKRRVADNGSPDSQGYGSNRAFIQNANIKKCRNPASTGGPLQVRLRGHVFPRTAVDLQVQRRLSRWRAGQHVNLDS